MSLGKDIINLEALRSTSPGRSLTSQKEKDFLSSYKTKRNRRKCATVIPAKVLGVADIVLAASASELEVRVCKFKL